MSGLLGIAEEIWSFPKGGNLIGTVEEKKSKKPANEGGNLFQALLKVPMKLVGGEGNCGGGED